MVGGLTVRSITTNLSILLSSILAKKICPWQSKQLQLISNILIIRHDGTDHTSEIKKNMNDVQYI